MRKTRINSDDLGDGQVKTADIADNAVTLAKIVDATSTSTASKIPIAGPGGKLALAWLSNVLASSDLTNDSALEKISNKGIASGYASLDSNVKVVQDPANATSTPTASKIPIAGVSGKLALGWLSAVLASSDLTNDSALEKVANKGVASGYASLNSSSLVVQDPANATATPSPGKIVVANGSGKIVAGWLSGVLGSADLTNDAALEKVANKAVASGYASLDSNVKVVQDPANATATPTASKIPIAGVGGKLAVGWLSAVLASSDLTNDAALEKVANKGAASGYASLNSSTLVVQDPANATAIPTPGKIVVANGSGKIVVGWLSGILASSDLTNDSSLEKTANKGVASGYASLDSNTKVVQDPANATSIPTASKIPIAGVSGKLALGWLSSVLASSDLTNDSALEKVANKAVASGYASLNSNVKVVQDPANATVTPTASKIPIADVSGKLALGWLSAVLASSDLTNDSALEKTANKGAASGYASLDSNTKVVQDPANATATPTASKLPIAGVGGKLAIGWMSGVLASSDLTNDSALEKVANKGAASGYASLDSNILVPISQLPPNAIRFVRVATTTNITLSGTQTIDGVVLVAGDRVLVKDQSTASQNGIYVVSAGAWSRASDMATSAQTLSGMQVNVSEGSAQTRMIFILETDAPIILATTSLVFRSLNFYLEVIDASTVTTTSTSDVVMTNMTLTLPKGTYHFIFDGLIYNTTNNRDNELSLYKAGVQVANSIKTTHSDSSTERTTVTIHKIISVNGSEAVDVRWHTSANTAGCLQKHFMAIRLR